MTETPNASPPPPVHPRRKLAQATAISAVVALIVLVVAVLPAEYGVDPTGIGGAFGFARLSDDAPVIVDTTGQGMETLYSFDLAWQIREEAILERDGELDTVAVQERVRVPFTGTNLTHMTAILTWQDDDMVGGQRTDPDQFEVSIKAPNGRESQFVSGENDETGGGRIEAFLQWRSTPTPGLNSSGAYTIDTREDASAQGDWQVLVRMYVAGGNDAGTDPGNAWHLTVRARTYAITNLGTFGTDSPGDRVALTLPPGSAVEYKFRMDEGADMTYHWTSTAPLTVDFHGDEPGNEDEPTTHKQGITDKDQGNFTAPFSGRHGWWWYNSGPETITVTLTTQGKYTILGVV